MIRMPFVCDGCGFLTEPEPGRGEVAFTLILTAFGLAFGAGLFALGTAVAVCILCGIGVQSHANAGDESKFLLPTLVGGAGIFAACLGTFRRLLRRWKTLREIAIP